MKKRFLLSFLLLVMSVCVLTGCGSSDKKSAVDELKDDQDIMTQLTQQVITDYHDVSEEEAEYYKEDGTNLESTAVTGFEQAQSTDHVGKFLYLGDGKETAKASFSNGARNNVICSMKATFENRTVTVNVSFVKNNEFYHYRDQIISGIQAQAQTQNYSDDDLKNLIQQSGYSSLEDYATQMLESSNNGFTTDPVYPVKADECEVSPDYTKAELLSNAAENTGIGMGTVFLVLIFISFIISLLKYVPKLLGKKEEEKKEKKAPAPAAPAESPAAGTPAVREEDDAELIAVITAAIQAAQKETGTYTTDSKDKLIVRSIRRVR